MIWCRCTKLVYIYTYTWLLPIVSLVSLTTIREFSIDGESSKKFDKFSETAAIRVNELKYYGNTLYYNNQGVLWHCSKAVMTVLMICDIHVIEQAMFIDSILVKQSWLCWWHVIRGIDILWQYIVVKQSSCLNWYHCNQPVMTVKSGWHVRIILVYQGKIRIYDSQCFRNKCCQKYEFYRRKGYQKLNAIRITAIMSSTL